MKLKNVIIYTDGAYRRTCSIGGWGALIIYNDIRKEIYGGEYLTTNNRMELLAAINALSVLKTSCNVNLYTDSKYLQLGIMVWIKQWLISNWKNSSNHDVKNKDLWMLLYKLSNYHHVNWNWVKSHNNNIRNDYADLLANKGIDKFKNNQNN